MDLTTEQSQFLRHEGTEPIQVRDPTTNKTYVLVAAEAFQKVRHLLDTDQPPAPAGEGEAGHQPPSSPPAEVRPLRQRLRDLPVPPEVAARAKKRCKELWLWGKRARQELLDQYLFQWYYGGKYVGYLVTPEGRVVVAVGWGLLDEAFDRQLAFLGAEERRNCILDAVDPWDDDRSIILSLGLNREG
jgi:hypothetical protein